MDSKKKAVSPQDRREQIVLGALKVFCKKGYDGATINDIVKQAECSHGLFYHYFKSKKEIFDAVAENRGVGMNAFLDKVLEEDSSYVNKLYKLTEYAFENTKNDEIFAYRYYFFLTTFFSKAESGNLPEKCKKPSHLRMIDFFEQGIVSGEFSDKYTAREYTKLYNSIIQGATLNFILCPKEFRSLFQFPLPQLIVDIFKKGVTL